MCTGINKSPDFMVGLEYYEYHDTRNLMGDKITGPGSFIFPADTNPLLLEHGPTFVIQKLERMIDRGR